MNLAFNNINIFRYLEVWEGRNNFKGNYVWIFIKVNLVACIYCYNDVFTNWWIFGRRIIRLSKWIIFANIDWLFRFK